MNSFRITKQFIYVYLTDQLETLGEGPGTKVQYRLLNYGFKVHAIKDKY